MHLWVGVGLVAHIKSRTSGSTCRAHGPNGNAYSTPCTQLRPVMLWTYAWPHGSSRGVQ
jgi:hypothetical protein